MAIVLPHGVLFRGNAGTIRKALLEEGLSDTWWSSCQYLLQYQHPNDGHHSPRKTGPIGTFSFIDS